MNSDIKTLSSGAQLFILGLRNCSIALRNGHCYPCALERVNADPRLILGANHLEEMLTLLTCFSLRNLNLNPPEATQLDPDELMLLRQLQTLELGSGDPCETLQDVPLHPKLHNLYCLAAHLYLNHITAKNLTTVSLHLVKNTRTDTPLNPVFAAPQGTPSPLTSNHLLSLGVAYPADRLQTTKVPE
jgi:hypothetical protein